MQRSPMSPPSPTDATTNKKNSTDLRKEIKLYIENERDTSVKRWMALKERIRAEDLRRDQFMSKRLSEKASIVPSVIQKVITDVKKAAKSTMRNKGGNPYTILRDLFRYWDSTNIGSLSAMEFDRCIDFIAIPVSPSDKQLLFSHYSTKEDGRWYYRRFLLDLQRDEPTLIQFIGDIETEKERLEAKASKKVKTAKPQMVEKFIEAVRYSVLNKMRAEGNTAEFVLKKMLNHYDLDHSWNIDAKELRKAGLKYLGVDISEKDAQDVIDFYDREKKGQIYMKAFIGDVCGEFPSFLVLVESTPRSLAHATQTIKTNPFNLKTFSVKPNQLLERVKDAVMKSLDLRIQHSGGSYKSWAKEAFLFWDPEIKGYIARCESLQGAMKRLGVVITQNEAQSLLNLYDRDKSGRMDYNLLVDDISNEELNFIADTTSVQKPYMRSTVSARAPSTVMKLTKMFREAGYAFSRKSHGIIEPSDVVHGTFLRFDVNQEGHIAESELIRSSKELGISLRKEEAVELMAWFDTDGSGRIDYNEFVNQLYPDAGGLSLLTSISLPSLKPASFRELPKGKLKPPIQSVSGKPFENLAASVTVLPRYAYKLDDPIEVENAKAHLIETRLIKEARRQLRKNQIMEEKKKIEAKIHAVDSQRRRIIEEYKARKESEGARITAELKKTVT